MNIILHPWRLASEPVPIELRGKPLLIEDFLGNYTVGFFFRVLVAGCVR